MFYLKRPCGITVAFCEMYRAESIIHAIVFICSIFGFNDATMREAEGGFIGYDRACDLEVMLHFCFLFMVSIIINM
jgi:hypothetical protein